jgi:Rrf2 family protein
MMKVSQKCQYGLRAVYELAKRYGNGPVAVADVAKVQAIPPRFLELILRQLRQGGIVESRRGPQGGYTLAVRPDQLTIGRVIRFFDGPLAPVSCVAEEPSTECPLHGRCAFLPMWERAREAVSAVFDTTTFQGLVESEKEMRYVPSYSI